MSEDTLSPLPMDPLEAELIALGRTLVVDPPALDLVERVLARVAGPDHEDAAASAALRTAPPSVAPLHPSRGVRGWPAAVATSLRAPRRRALAAAVAALLLVVLVPPVRAAVLDFFRIGGVTVREVPSPPGAPATSDPQLLPPTSPGSTLVSSLEEASKRVGFDIAAPPELGKPTTIAVAREGRAVELTWGTGVGSTRLDVFDGSLSFGYLKSVWEAVTPTDVAGKEAVWFASPHLIEWTDRAGVTVTSPPRIAGPTLVWVDRNQAGREITYRLEGHRTLEAARKIAESVP